jgi:hypothetical protein
MAAVVSAAGCGTPNNELPERVTPDPTASGAVTVPDDAPLPTCLIAGDCAGAVTLGPCQTEACVEGKCVAADGFVGMLCAKADAPACMSGACAANGAKLECSATVVAPDGTPCGQAFEKCGPSPYCKAGVCMDPCNDGDPCTTDACTPDGCEATPSSGASCNDGDPCTGPDVCDDGECTGPKVCDCSTNEDCLAAEDGNPCNGTLECKDGKCKVKAGTPILCEETGNEPCTTNTCQPETAECKTEVAQDGVACDDGVECTTGDSCLAGACTEIEETVCEWICDDDVDQDADSATDCFDSDCFGIGDCPTPACPDGTCQDFAGETCASCVEDCGECPPECGDGELQEVIEEECDDGNTDSGDGCDATCKVEALVPAENVIVITEIMKNPDAVPDPTGEWFEIQNLSKSDVDVNAFTIEDMGTDKHRLYKKGGLVIPANGIFVLGNSANPEENGGITPDYVYDNFALGNGEDQIILKAGESVVDQVAYVEGGDWPNAKGGKSLSLDPAETSIWGNDSGLNWCVGQTPFGMGDLGTPGTGNPPCPFCGDNACNAQETCTSCQGDCGCTLPDVCFLDACCTPACTGKDCGDDGCGATCGTCKGAQDECVAGKCVCQPACAGKVCGDDGCGATCGTCKPTEACQPAGYCLLLTCTDKVKNGLETDVDCGGNCSKCNKNHACLVASDCVSNVCTANKCQ